MMLHKLTIGLALGLALLVSGCLSHTRRDPGAWDAGLRYELYVAPACQATGDMWRRC